MKSLISVLFVILSFKTFAFKEVCDDLNSRQLAKVRQELTLNLEKIDTHLYLSSETNTKDRIHKFMRRIDQNMSSLRTLEEKKICSSIKESIHAVLIQMEKKQKELESYFLGLSQRPKVGMNISELSFQDV